MTSLTMPVLLGVMIIVGFTMQNAFATSVLPTAYTNLSLYDSASTTAEKIGNRTLELDIDVLSSNETHIVMQFRLYDENTNKTIEHVTYLMNVTEVDESATDNNNSTGVGKLLLSDFLHTHDGILTLQLEHVERQQNITIQGEKGDFLKAWIPDNRTGVLHATSPPLWNATDDNRYSFNVAVYGIDRDTLIFTPDEEPTFVKVVTVPEFGLVASLVMAVAIVGVIIASKRFRTRY